MPKQRLGSIVGALAGFIGGCIPSASRMPVATAPVPAENIDPSTPHITLSFSAGTFHYHLRQTTTIHVDDSADSTSSRITTTAVLLVDITTPNDSAYDVLVSVDSLQMRTEGLIPSRSAAELPSLGPVFRASFRGTSRTVETHLPDSLCAYSQFIIAARELVLPQLGAQVRTPLTVVWRDTATILSCRAGSRIRMFTTQYVRGLKREPIELTLKEMAELEGTGRLNRDSVTVSGSIKTRGSASFTGSSRLPSLVQTESDGAISVRLGNSIVVFRQNSTLYIQQREVTPPN